MSTVVESNLKSILPSNGPSINEVKKYLDKYNNEYIVIKCGGSVLIDPILFDIFISDVAVLKKLGLSPIIVHGGGKRIKRVEDVLELGEEVQVRVEDIDPNGKVSLVLAAEAGSEEQPSSAPEGGDSGELNSESSETKQVSFEDEFEETLAEELGDLGPEAIGGNQQRNRNRRNKGHGGRNK